MLDFDGSSDYVLRSSGLNKVADSKVGTFAAWCRIDGGAGTNRSLLTIYNGTTLVFGAGLNTSNEFEVRGGTISPSTLRVRSNTTYAAGDTFRHFLCSWDVAAGTATLYITDSEDEKAGATLTDTAIPYTNSTTEAVGAVSHDGSDKWNGVIGEVFFDPTTSVDLSDTDVRRFFISQDGVDRSVTQGSTVTPKSHADGEPDEDRTPVGYGSDGGQPTGAQPLIYLTAALTANKGTGGQGWVIQGSPSYVQHALPYRRSAHYDTGNRTRWFDSDRSGFSYPREETIIQNGQRVGQDEMDEQDRDDHRDTKFTRFIFHGDAEDDSAENRDSQQDIKFWRR